MFDAVSAPTVKGKSCVFLNNGFELNSVSNAIDFRDFLIPFCSFCIALMSAALSVPLSF